MNPIIVVLEVVVAGGAALMIWRLLRTPFLYNLCAGLALLVGWGVAWAVGLLGEALLKPVLKNPLIMVLTVFALTCVAFAGAVTIVRRTLKPRKRPTGRPLLKRGTGAVLNLLLVGLLLAALIGFLDFMVSLASLSDLEPEIRERSLYLTLFLPKPTGPGAARSGTPAPRQRPADEDAASANNAPLRDVMSRQERFFDSLQEGFALSKTSLARKLGTQQAIEQLQALQFLLDLSPDDTAWLVESTPELRALTQNERLLAVLRDEHLLTLVTRVGQGSASAIYDLSEHAAVQELLTDPAIIHAIKALDLPRLQQRVVNRSHDGQEPGPGKATPRETADAH